MRYVYNPSSGFWVFPEVFSQLDVPGKPPKEGAHAGGILIRGLNYHNRLLLQRNQRLLSPDMLKDILRLIFVMTRHQMPPKVVSSSQYKSTDVHLTTHASVFHADIYLIGKAGCPYITAPVMHLLNLNRACSGCLHLVFVSVTNSHSVTVSGNLGVWIICPLTVLRDRDWTLNEIWRFANTQMFVCQISDGVILNAKMHHSAICSLPSCSNYPCLPSHSCLSLYFPLSLFLFPSPLLLTPPPPPPLICLFLNSLIIFLSLPAIRPHAGFCWGGKMLGFHLGKIWLTSARRRSPSSFPLSP